MRPALAVLQVLKQGLDLLGLSAFPHTTPTVSLLLVTYMALSDRGELLQCFPLAGALRLE